MLNQYKKRRKRKPSTCACYTVVHAMLFSGLMDKFFQNGLQSWTGQGFTFNASQDGIEELILQLG